MQISTYSAIKKATKKISFFVFAEIFSGQQRGMRLAPIDISSSLITYDWKYENPEKMMSYNRPNTVVGSDTVRQSVCISADPETHVKFAQPYIELGFDRLFFHSAGPDQRAFLQGYSRDVLPELRHLYEERTKSAARKST